MKRPCPINTCHTDNDLQANVCMCCGISLHEYFRLFVHPAYLFNQGLDAARKGNFALARDLFAAVIYWCPKDWNARNAFAAACLELDDLDEARRQWQLVRDGHPKDICAAQGIAVLEHLLMSRKAMNEEQANHQLIGSSHHSTKKKQVKGSSHHRRKKK